MKWHKIWIVVFLMLIESLGFSSISFAEEGKWTKKADMLTARVGLSASVVSGKIYVVGGFAGNPLSKLEEYDPATDKWTKKADMPTARMDLSTSVVNGKVYAIGGQSGPALSTVEEYDTGFAGLYIEARGKLPTSWGKMKSRYYPLAAPNRSSGDLHQSF